MIASRKNVKLKNLLNKTQLNLPTRFDAVDVVFSVDASEL